MARQTESQRGQALALFALSLLAIIAMAGLLYTAAQALVVRRQLQDTADAAALAASNLLIVQGGCSANGNGGTPRAAFTTTARSSVAANMPTYNASDVVVSCPTGYNNYAVAVTLNSDGPSFFGASPLHANASGTAVNGQATTEDFSVALLDPSNPTWGAQRNGCASYLVNGGVTVTYEGSIMVNSKCTLAVSSNGAFKASNSAFQMNMTNGATLRLGGEYSAGTAGKITPDPVQNARPLLPDPLGGLIQPCSSLDTSNCLGNAATLPTRSMASNASGQCFGQNRDPCILLPGTYSGGLAAANGNGASTLLLRPGVYYIRGGGLSLKSGAGRIFSIPSAAVLPDALARARYATNLTDTVVSLSWQLDCPPPPSATTCGVLIYNAPGTSGNWQTSGNNADTISNGSQGVLMLRAYNPNSDALGNGALFQGYEDLVLWQQRTPLPGANSPQPDMTMAGGACTVLSGTVYGPGAAISFGGSSCGSGGGNDPASTLQFVVWDLTLSGNNNFHFAYRSGAFAVPTAYGLVR